MQIKRMAILSITKAIDIASQEDIPDEELSFAYMRRGEYYINAGQFSNAIEDMAKAVEIDPNNTEANDYLSYMLENQ